MLWVISKAKLVELDLDVLMAGFLLSLLVIIVVREKTY